MKFRLSMPLRGHEAEDDGESWVFALPVGRPFFDGNSIRLISEEQAKLLLANFERANAFFAAQVPEGKTRYWLPVKSNHSGAERFGDLVQGKLWGEGDEYGIYLRVNWTGQTWAGIQASTYQHTSIGVKPHYMLEDGTDVGPLPAELSITAEPRIQTIGTIQDTLSLRLSRTDLTQHLDEGEMDELQELLQSIANQLQTQSEQIAALTEHLMAAPDGDEEEEEVEAAQDAGGDEEEAVEAAQDGGEEEPIEASQAGSGDDVEDVDGKEEDPTGEEEDTRIEDLESTVFQLSQTVDRFIEAVIPREGDKPKGLPLNLSEHGPGGDPPQRENRETFIQAKMAGGMSKINAMREWHARKG